MHGSDHAVTITFQVGAIITSLTGRIFLSVMCSRVCRRNRLRLVISPGACRAWQSCSKRVLPKIMGMLAEGKSTGTISFGKDTKGKQRLVITDLEGATHEYLIPKDKHVLVHDGQVVNKGESILRRRA